MNYTKVLEKKFFSLVGEDEHLRGYHLEIEKAFYKAKDHAIKKCFNNDNKVYKKKIQKGIREIEKPKSCSLRRNQYRYQDSKFALPPW